MTTPPQALPTDAHPPLPWKRLGLVAVLWALQLFLFQHLTFAFDYPVPVHKQLIAGFMRLVLDLLFCVGLVFVLPRVLVAVALGVFVLFVQAAGYYHEVFGRAVTWTTFRAQSSEGLEGAGFDWSYLNWPVLVGSLLLLGVELWVLYRGRGRLGRRGGRVVIGAAALAGYVLSVGAIHAVADPLSKLRTFASASRMGMTYGYLPTWLGEYWYLDMETLTAEAVAQREHRTDRLSAIEAPVELTGDVVILQLESWDWRVHGHRVDGREVTPFLNALAEESMAFMVTAFHDNGSGDCDFSMLTATPPSPTVMTYTLLDYPYEDTLPEIAREAGYETTIFHGNSGRFFSRRHAYAQMPFDRVVFMEELLEEFGAAEGLWGVSDDQVFDLSVEMLEAASTPQLHYIISLTTHQPFIYLEPGEATFLPGGEGLVERYFNNMSYLDREVRGYIERLPEGTLVVLIGDHRAAVDYVATPPEPAGQPEHVPLLIHRVGEPLAGRQQSRGSEIARSGELTAVDVGAYVQSCFRSHLAEDGPGGSDE